LLSTVSRFVLVCTSTTGVAPLTLIVSATPLTRISAFTVVTPPPEISSPSRWTVAKPGSENVTAYVPGRRSTI
jgi:hypothetical protein